MSTRKPALRDLHVYMRVLRLTLVYRAIWAGCIGSFALFSLSSVLFADGLQLAMNALSGYSLQETRSILAQTMRNWADPMFSDAATRRVQIPLLLLVLLVLRSVGFTGSEYGIRYLSSRLVHELRCRIASKLLHVPGHFFDRHPDGHLVSILNFKVQQIADSSAQVALVVLREGVTAIAFLSYMFYLNWRLSLICIATVPLLLRLTRTVARRQRILARQQQRSMGDLTHITGEVVSGNQEIRVFGAQELETKRFGQTSNAFRQQTNKIAMASSLLQPLSHILITLPLLFLFWLLLDPARAGEISPGALTAFLVSAVLLSRPVRRLNSIIEQLQQGLVAAEDIFQLIDEETEPDSGEQRLGRARGTLEFRHIHFSYAVAGAQSKAVLSDINFVVEPGKIVAIVGRTGAGKTTLVRLMSRLYYPSSGHILIDGNDTAQLRISDVRRQFAVVSQQPVLFNDSLYNNIAFGELRGAAPDLVRNAATQAHATEFIECLPDGFESSVGNQGKLLSGGQKQRIAVARALLKNAPFLILDEATSALDNETEQLLRSVLRDVSAGRSVVVIAHRLNTVRNADLILVLDHGRIVERGQHRELLAQGGLYAHLTREELRA